MRLRVLVALVAALTLFVAPAADASSTYVKRDPRGDARPFLDVVKFVVTTTPTETILRGRVADLTYRGQFHFSMNAGAKNYGIALTWRDGKPRGTLTTCWDDACGRVTCPGLRRYWDVVENVVQVRVPMNCFKRPQRWLFTFDSGPNGATDGTFISR